MVVPLQNTIRDYAWGSETALPELLGVAPDGKPQAEMWMGAHESAPSVPPNGDTLYDVVSDDPAAVLGEETAERFGGGFPFLAKLLAAGQPLSIQAHPSRDQAIDGYERDEAAGIPRDAADRNYKDAWPKPEILIALGPFDALVGFRPLDRTIALLEALAPAGFGELTDQLRDGKLREALHRLHEFRPRRDPSAGRCARRGCRAVRRGRVRAGAGDALEAVRGLPGRSRRTRGVAAEPGRLERFDALYLPAGNLHAYLHGLGFEVMANSDNVLRGGLTHKHIDVPDWCRWSASSRWTTRC